MRTLLAVALLAAAAASAEAAQAPEPASAAQHDQMHGMTATPLFRTRESSGTTWVPDATPMYGLQRPLRGWQVMVHGQGFGQFLYESGSPHHGGHQAGSINWVMAMARRPAGTGRIGLRFMASLEPWSVAGCGYPNLLATGEVCDGDTIHDQQHPHDLFMEVAADYERPLTPSLRWQVYGGLAGEPALGPVGFLHRLSALSNLAAPIAHHWLDSTHIAFGVVTTGLSGSRWKAELSAFNGREPDEERANIDLQALDSIAARVSFLAAPGVALQVSAGHLRESEAGFAGQPRRDVARATASISHVRDRGQAHVWATMLAYGTNAGAEALVTRTIDVRTHALLLESSLTIRDRHSWFGRLEVVGKLGHDLHVHEAEDRVFTVGKLQAGYVRLLAARRGLVPGIGATVSASLLPAFLGPRYEGRVAPGVGVFATLRAGRMRM